MASYGSSGRTLIEISVWLIPGHCALLMSLQMNVWKDFGNPEINLVMTSDISESLIPVLLKTQSSRYIKPVTKKNAPPDALKNLLDRFQFPVTIVVDLINFVLILIPTL